MSLALCIGCGRLFYAGGGDEEVDASQTTDDGGDIDADLPPSVGETLVRLSNDPAESDLPCVTRLGDGLAVAWTDYRNTTPNIYTTTIAANGTLGRDEIVLSPLADVGLAPACTGGASFFAVAFPGTQGGTPTITLASTNFQGGVVNHGEIVASSGISDAAAATSSGHFAHVWMEQDQGLRFAAYDPTGSLVVSPTDLVPAGSFGPSLVWNGSGYAMTWTERATTSDEVFLAFMDAQGVIQGAPIPVSPDDGVPSYESDLVWTGDTYGIAWTDTPSAAGRVMFARVEANGTVGPPAQISPENNTSFRPSLSWHQNRFALAWVDSTNSAGDLLVATLDANGSTAQPIAVIESEATFATHVSSVGFGDHFAFVWTDYRDGPTSEIYLRY
jgi:hypothetical protein